MTGSWEPLVLYSKDFLRFYQRNNKYFMKTSKIEFIVYLMKLLKKVRDINAMKQIKPEKYENLTRMFDHQQRTSLCKKCFYTYLKMKLIFLSYLTLLGDGSSKSKGSVHYQTFFHPICSCPFSPLLCPSFQPKFDCVNTSSHMLDNSIEYFTVVRKDVQHLRLVLTLSKS